MSQFDLNSIQTLAVLGAPDPEMQEIEYILASAGLRIAYASVNGIRVHPGNAYKADGVLYPDGIPAPEDGCTILRIECDFTGERCPWPVGGRLIVIDHHRPGDPGYGQKPAKFLAASSLGQLLRLLNGGQWRWYATKEEAPNGVSGWRLEQSSIIRGLCDWFPSSEQIWSAAADHCLEQAYRGNCPGVEPELLMLWRTTSRATFQNRPVEDVRGDIIRARYALKRAVRCPACNGTGLSVSYGGEYGTTPYCSPDPCEQCKGKKKHKEIADLRGEFIPELYEAAAREGIPALAEIVEKGGRKKIVLQAATPDLVRRFLAGEIVTGLTEHYGDPERGFAGGYLP